MKPTISHERLLALLRYDPAIGAFYWNINRQRIKAGAVAGYYNPRGYRAVKVDDRPYLIHRLAWFYVHGRWPADQIDHINGVKDDNRIENLREASTSENKRNGPAYRTNTSGFKGAYWNKKNQCWYASIAIDGKLCHLGKFQNPRAAHAAYCEAAKRHYGEFFRAA